MPLSRRTNCWDNALAESFFATLMKELVHHESYATRAAARAILQRDAAKDPDRLPNHWPPTWRGRFAFRTTVPQPQGPQSASHTRTRMRLALVHTIRCSSSVNSIRNQDMLRLPASVPKHQRTS